MSRVTLSDRHYNKFVDWLGDGSTSIFVEPVEKDSPDTPTRFTKADRQYSTFSEPTDIGDRTAYRITIEDLI